MVILYTLNRIMLLFFEEKKFDNPPENFLFAPWVKHLISTYIRFMVFKITTQVIIKYINAPLVI